jgi:replicative DNA helicase
MTATSDTRFDVATPEAPIHLPPRNLEAEQALLGAVLYDNSAFERVTDGLRAQHFHEPFHQRLWAAIEDHIRRGQLAEPILLASRFAGDAAYEEFGGVRYLADLVDRAPPAMNAPDYARTIYDLALRRDLIRLSGEIAGKAAGDASSSAREQIEGAEQELYSLAETGGISSGVMTFATALRGAVEIAAEAYGRDGRLAGVSTGLIDLDQILGGMHGSDLLILAGRPSMGKTALATNIAFDVARNYAFEETLERSRKTVKGGVVLFFFVGNVGRAIGHASPGRCFSRALGSAA